MNLDRAHYGRITIQGVKKSLGHAPINQLLVRASQEIKKAKAASEYTIQLEISTTQLPAASTLDRESLFHEHIQQHSLTDPNEEVFEGVSAARLAEAMESTEYSAYSHICNPANRLGVEPSVIRTVANEYKTKFPDVAQHVPVWLDS